VAASVAAHRRTRRQPRHPTVLRQAALAEREGTFHVGRRHVTDAAGAPMVLDWRAPISRKFYRASAKDPQDVSVRRRFGFVEGQLTSFEDEHLQAGEEVGTSRILLDEIERPRIGPMQGAPSTGRPTGGLQQG
jgi:hypothetical protein